MPSAPPLPTRGREVRLAAVPEALPAPEHFTVVETVLPYPGRDEVLVRNRHSLVFPGLRTLLGDESDGVPLPPLRVGDTLFGPAVGEVVAAPGSAGPRVGNLVTHLRGWRDYALVPIAECGVVDGTLPDPVAHLAQGSAPYGALTRPAKVRPGDVVLVTGAAGAVGTLAGQIARLLGAGRVIGTTGSSWKAERLVSELGYDATVLRGEGPIGPRLAAAAPDGIDVVLDTVGGDQLTAALALARRGARVALVGALSGQLAPGRAGGSAPAEIDTYRLLIRGVSLHGYSGVDHPDVEREWTERFGGWLRSGEIRFAHTSITGMDQAPAALPDLIAGRHFGAAVLDLTA